MAVIQKRGDSYRVLIRKKGQKPISKTFKQKAVAQRWADQTEYEMSIGALKGAPDKATVADTITKYVQRMAQIGKPISHKKDLLLRRVSERLGDKRLDELTTEVLVDWVSGMKVCPSTRQGYVISFRTVLTTAETLWDATPNMKAYEKASVFLRKHGIVGESESRDRRVTDAELEAILAAMVAPRLPYRDILFFQLHSAFRIGETCRLRWADLNEEDRTVLIRQRKHPKKKTDEIAPLLDAAWEIIQRQPRGGEFIFPYEPNTISHAFADFAEGAGVEDIHVHDIRHEAISRLFEMGFDITEVRLFSGHKDLKMLQRYTHLRPRDIRQGPVAIRRYHEQMAAAGNVVPINRAA